MTMQAIRKSMLLLAGSCLAATAGAQNDVDAIRYSQLIPSITARSLAMGGAFGALGADFSSLSNNPAGIALYRRSEFTFTPAFANFSTESTYLGEKNRDNKYNFNIGNIGLVIAFPKDERNTSPWRSWSFALGYNKLNNYQSRSIYEGLNTKTSLLDAYVEEANGTTYDQLGSDGFTAFSSDLAFQTYLIDTLPGSVNQYFSAVPNGGEIQRRFRETRGSSGEALLAFGGNYMDRVFWGVTLAFPYLRYNEDVIYEEIDPADDVQQTTPGVDSSYAAYLNFESFRLSQQVATSGSGFQAKFGLLFRPNDWLRFGAAIHSPGFYNMHDEWINSIHANFTGDSYDYESPFGSYDYNLTTPFRASGSVAMIYRQQGVLSFDYEFTDYTAAKLSASDYSFIDENQTIRSTYAQGHNFRAGGEWKYGIFSFRLGAAYYSGIVRSELSTTGSDQHKFIYSGGIGIREEYYFVDIGYAMARGNESYRNYELASTPEAEPAAISTLSDHRLLVTFGFRF
jgi:hypothetical protein